MKTNTIERQVELSAGETQEFSIKANGKAFKALIDGLYENKIQSIVREIWSNALDAHMMADCADKPFAVTFPTMFNPTFIVRDYGISLEHHDVMKLYTTVFESTKEDDEVATGKFGLGSKSPFAYTDTFSIAAFLNGSKRLYSAVIGKHGIPAIHFLGEVDTDEPNGLEVSFPIQSNDIRAFRKAAQRVSHGFEVKPTVLRAEEEDEFEGWPELEVLSTGTDWKLLKGVIEGYSEQAYAKMGPVLYPINSNAIDDLEPAERTLLKSTLLIEFDMGDLEIGVSREALSYGTDEPTVPSIRKKLRRIVSEMVDQFQKDFDACATYWEACVMYRSLVNSQQTPEPVREALRQKATWNGEQLVTDMRFKDAELPGVQVSIMTGTRLNHAMYRFKKDNDPTVAFKDDTLFVIEEEATDQRAPSKLKYYIDSLDRADRPSTVYWLRTRTPSRKYGPVDAMVLLQKFYETVEGADFVMIADLAEPPRSSYSNGGTGVRRPVQVREWDGYDFDKRTDIVFEDGGFYVPLERMQAVYPAGMQSPQYMWRALREAGVIESGAVLYGAPKSLWKKFESDKWVNIYDLAADAFKKSKPKASLSKRALIEAVRSTGELRWMDEILKINDLEDGPAKEALTYYQQVTNYTMPDVQGFIKLAEAVGQRAIVSEWSEFDRTDLDYHVEAIEEFYPLLSTIRENNRYGDKPVDKITEYVQMCDKLHAIDSQTTVAAAA